MYNSNNNNNSGTFWLKCLFNLKYLRDPALTPREFSVGVVGKLAHHECHQV